MKVALFISLLRHVMDFFRVSFVLQVHGCVVFLLVMTLDGLSVRVRLFAGPIAPRAEG